MTTSAKNNFISIYTYIYILLFWNNKEKFWKASNDDEFVSLYYLKIFVL